VRVIAITGGIASGKTTVLNHLKALGAACIDADAISRTLTAPGGAALPAIRQAFGQGVFQQDGALNRRALGALVFGDGEARGRLNAIVHPLVRAEMERQLRRLRLQGERVAVLDVPLLYESGMETLADEVWLVAVPAEVQLQRLMARDGYTREEALARIHSQMPLEQKRARADLVIDTDLPLQALYERLTALWEEVNRP